MHDLARSKLQLTGRILVPVIAVVYSVSFYLSVADLDGESANYPRLAIWFLLPLLLFEIAAEVVNWYRAGGSETPDRQLIRQVWFTWRKSIYTIVLLAAFILLIPQIGFYLAAVPFLFLLPLALGIRRPVVLLVVMVSLLVASYVLFSVVLAVPLPSSPLG